MDEWEETWNHRQAALEQLFGKSADTVLHALIRLHLGGQADILVFPNHLPGTLYVTADLTGELSDQVPNARWTKYELAIAQRSDDPWAPNLICRLARYVLETPIEPGDTMDIGDAVPKPSEIAALLFSDYGTFELDGSKQGVLLCMGITARELSKCRKEGSEHVLAQLRSAGVHPFTDLRRKSG